MSPIHFGRLRPRPSRQESAEDDKEIVLSNRRLSPDKNEDTDADTEDDEDTDETMSAEEESAGGASPPAVESQVFDYGRPKRRRSSRSGAFASGAGAVQQPDRIRRQPRPGPNVECAIAPTHALLR